jgi:hypothetical protein
MAARVLVREVAQRAGWHRSAVPRTPSTARERRAARDRRPAPAGLRAVVGEHIETDRPVVVARVDTITSSPALRAADSAADRPPYRLWDRAQPGRPAAASCSAILIMSVDLPVPVGPRQARCMSRSAVDSASGRSDNRIARIGQDRPCLGSSNGGGTCRVSPSGRPGERRVADRQASRPASLAAVGVAAATEQHGQPRSASAEMPPKTTATNCGPAGARHVEQPDTAPAAAEVSLTRLRLGALTSSRPLTCSIGRRCFRPPGPQLISVGRCIRVNPPEGVVATIASARWRRRAAPVMITCQRMSEPGADRLERRQ